MINTHINTRVNARWRIFILILLCITFVLVSGCTEKTTLVDSWQLDIDENIVQENAVDAVPIVDTDIVTMPEPEITWLGHASFLFDDGIVVYTDPYNIEGNQDNMKKADVILITHDHADHLDIDSISKIATADTVFIAPQKAASQLEGDVAGDVLIIDADMTIDIKGISVSAVPAYNINKKFHPKGEGVGYMFTIGNTTIYQAGDTDFIPEMNEIDCDIAILPIGGTYTMDMDEAVKAASAITPETVIPMHYNSIEGLDADAEEFKRLVEVQNPAIDVRIL